MAKLNVVPIESNGDGINTYYKPDKIKPSEMTGSSRNIRTDADTFGPRKGYTSFGDEKTSGDKVNQMAVYTRKLATNDRLIMFYNNKVWKIDPDTESTWTEISQSLITDSSNINTASFDDWLFVFNGVDKPIRIADTTVTQPFTQPASVSLANFVPSFGEVYNGSLFVAGVPTAPNTVFISKASTSATPEDVYDFSGSLTSYGDANELLFPSRVTAIKKLSTALVIFTIDEAFYIPGLREFSSTVTFDVQPIGGSSGAVSQRATTVVENDVYYLTPQREIRSIRRGFSDTLSMITTPLSVRIQRFLDNNMSLDQINQAYSLYNPIEKEYHLTFTATGNASNTLRVVGDINSVGQDGVPVWTIDDNCPFSSGVVYKGTTYGGSSAIGQAYKLNIGTADDDDANIESLRVTKDFTANNPLTVKNFRMVEVFGEMTTNTSITATIYIDDQNIGEFVIDSNDIPSGVDAGGGIGTQSIGDFSVGDEVDDDFSSTDERFEFRKRMPIRQTGYKMRIEFSTDGTSNDYRIRHMQYGFIARGKLFNSVIEK